MSDRMNLFRFKIRGRLVAGFAALCAIMAGAVAFNLAQSNRIAGNVHDIADLRAPVAVLAMGIARDVNASLAALRGRHVVLGQLPMLALMVGYTCAGLLLLFSP